jgi:hypothetical protein
MIRLLRTLAACLALLTGPAAAVQIEGQRFDDRIELAERTLQLNGVGLRAVAWLKGYAAGLYLVERARSADAAVAMPGPKRLQMRMLVEVEAPEFAKAIDKGIRRNTPRALHAPLAERQRQFREAVLALKVVRAGDVVDLDFVPGRGTTMTVNGTPRGAPLPGDDFYGALLRIFVGPDPVDEDLKDGLLGRPPG